MCVILVATKNRPTRSLLDDCASANRDGGGVAWRDGKGVSWIKGVDLGPAEIHKLTEALPLPFVVHFRITTVGGTSTELCHPFPVNEAAEHAASGSAKAVVFHNGTWAPWQEHMIQSVTKAGEEVPGGPWSDSRAMAYLAHRHGVGFVSLIPDTQRVVHFGAKRMIIHGKGWHAINAGLSASNTNWMRRSYLREAAERIGLSEAAQKAERPIAYTPTTRDRVTVLDDDLRFDDLPANIWQSDGRGGLKHAGKRSKK